LRPKKRGVCYKACASASSENRFDSKILKASPLTLPLTCNTL